MRLPIAFRILSSLVIMPLACLSATAGDWPGFRGPTGMGISDAAGLPLVWGGPDDTNVIWKAPLLPADRETDPDQNQSSPVVSGGRVVLTLSYWPAGVEKSLTLPQHHVVCHRAEDGVRLWDTEVEPGPLNLQDLRGGYTAPTPAIADGRVFALFGSGVLHALPGADSAVSPFVTPDGRIYFASAGKSVVIAVAPELRILGESDLGDPSQAAAAVSGKRIFLKGRRNLFAVGLPKP